MIPDVRDAKYGKLHLLHDVQYLDGGQAVTPSVDQGPPTQDPNTPWVEIQEHIKNHNYFQTLYKDDKNCEEAGKKWLLECIPERYFGALKNCKTKFKHVSLRTMVEHIFCY